MVMTALAPVDRGGRPGAPVDRPRPGDPDGLDRRPRAGPRHPRRRRPRSRSSSCRPSSRCPALEIIRATVADALVPLGRPVDVSFTFAVPWTTELLTDGRHGRAAPGRDRAARPSPPPSAARSATRPRSRSTASSARRSADRCSTAVAAASRSRRSSRSDGAAAGSTAAARPTTYPRVMTDYLPETDRQPSSPARSSAVVGAGMMGAGHRAGRARGRSRGHPPRRRRGRDRPRPRSDPPTASPGVPRRRRRRDPAGDRRLDRRPAGPPARLGASLEQLGDEADVVIEAALESLELKQTIFRALDAVAARATILATNTSALVGRPPSPRRRRRPERVRRASLLQPGARSWRLVEVVAGPDDRSGASLAEAARSRRRRWGKTAVRSADAPGFIVNRVNRPFTLRALRLLEAGRAHDRGRSTTRSARPASRSGRSS